MKRLLLIAFTLTSTIEFRNAQDHFTFVQTKIFPTDKQALEIFSNLDQKNWRECVLDGTPPRYGQCRTVRVHEPVERHEWEEKVENTK